MKYILFLLACIGSMHAMDRQARRLPAMPEAIRYDDPLLRDKDRFMRCMESVCILLCGYTVFRFYQEATRESLSTGDRT